MIPIFKKTDIKKLLQSKIKINAKIVLLIKLFISNFSSILGRFIDFFIGDFLEKKFIFVRTDLDHFGSWTHLFFAIKYCGKKYPKKIVVSLGKNGTINPIWIKLFKKNSLIITNPFLRIAIMPLFFSRKAALDVNGWTMLTYRGKNKIASNFRSLPPLSTKIVESIYQSKENKKQIFATKSFSKYILFYAREGNWKYSVKKSPRNMPKKLVQRLLCKLLEKYDVVIIGDMAFPEKFKVTNYSNKIYNLEDLLNSNNCLYEIYSNSSFVIGSASGATHFPSMLFNKASLYITDIPLRHLDALYLVPTKFTNKKYELKIPKKDKWIITPHQKLINEEIIQSILEITDDFIDMKDIRKIKNYNNFEYKGPFNKFGRTLVKNPKGNIILHNEVPLFSEAADIFD